MIGRGSVIDKVAVIVLNVPNMLLPFCTKPVPCLYDCAVYHRDGQSGQADKGQTPDMATRLKTLARYMSINKHKAMASEYIAEQEAQQEATQQITNDNELSA